MQAMSDSVRENFFTAVRRANEMRAETVRAHVEALNGRFGKAYTAVGVITAELPLEKIREMEADPEIFYISPDRPVRSFGHIEDTAGASQTRSLVPGTTLDGRGVGIAVLDSGMDTNHKLIKASTGHPGVSYQRDFTSPGNSGS